MKRLRYWMLYAVTYTLLMVILLSHKFYLWSAKTFRRVYEVEARLSKELWPE